MSGRGVSALSTNQKNEPSGAPFVTGSADNGVSVDPVTGRIVLGDDGNAPNPGQLLSDRYISTMGFLIEIFGLVGTVQILENLLNVQGDNANPPNIRLENVSQPGSTCDFIHDPAGKLIIQFATGIPSGTMINMQNQVNITNLSGNPPVTAALFEVTSGAIATQQPSANGPGIWKLGKVVAAAVVLDGTQYVEVEIDGVIRKLALVV